MTTRDTLIKLADLYENTAKSGGRYFVGYMGGVKLLLMKRKDAKDGEPQWALHVAERSPRPAAHKRT